MGQPNVLGVIVAAIIPMVIGMVWYSPALFATKFMALVGKTHEELTKGGVGKAYALSFVSALVMSYVLAHVEMYGSAATGSSGVASGLSAGFWSWLGFVATTGSSTVLFEKRPSGLYLMNMGYYLACLLLMGLLLAMWK